MEEHTLAHFRGEYYYSPLANRLNAPSWETAGARDALERATELVRDTLAAPPRIYLSDEQSREVKALVVKAEASLANLEVHV
jgi:trimethylamine:corrinoid methyltransferase-like protein